MQPFRVTITFVPGSHRQHHAATSNRIGCVRRLIGRDRRVVEQPLAANAIYQSLHHGLLNIEVCAVAHMARMSGKASAHLYVSQFGQAKCGGLASTFIFCQTA